MSIIAFPQKHIAARRAMTLQSMSFIFGAILLAVAILGGGFEVKEIKISNVSVGVRIIAGIVGLFFIVLGFWQQPIALTEFGSAPGGSGMGPPQVPHESWAKL